MKRKIRMVVTGTKHLPKLLLLLVLWGVIDCSSKKGGVNDDPDNGVVRTYRKTGTIISEATMKDGKYNGPSREYFANGKVFTEVNYHDDKKEGIFKQYYEDGTLSKEAEYKNDLLDGWSKKYRKDGTMAWQARFSKDLPCVDLSEYYLNGTPKTEYPKIVIESIDQLRESGEYSLRISMSDKTTTVKFYQGKLTAGGCLDMDNAAEIFSMKKGECTLRFHLGPGGFAMEEIFIIAVVKTNQSNSYITTRMYHLAINN